MIVIVTDEIIQNQDDADVFRETIKTGIEKFLLNSFELEVTVEVFETQNGRTFVIWLRRTTLGDTVIESLLADIRRHCHVNIYTSVSRNFTVEYMI
jgi:hypothetical protein